MTIALILVSAAALIGWALLLFGPRAPKNAPAAREALEQEQKAREKLESELEKKRKELEEQKAATADLKDQLKQVKKKLHEQREAGKVESDLHKAREAVERKASIQLEHVREELAHAQAEIQRLKGELESRGRRPAPAAEPRREEPAAKEPPVQKVIRELNPAEKEKLEAALHDASKSKAKAAELEREVKRLRGRLETEKRVYTVTKGELDLVKDKFRALEKRLNRTLLENDILKRAIADLEKKTGMTAEKTAPTAEELATSDRSTEERQAAEARAAEERRATLEAESSASEPKAADSQNPERAAGTATADATTEPKAEARPSA